MKRREFVKSGIGLLTLGATGNAFGAKPCPPTISGAASVTCPRPVGTNGPISAMGSQMAPGTWSEITDTGVVSSLQTILDSYYPRSGGGIRSFLEYSIDEKWHSDGEIHFIGGGHPGPESPTIHLIYSEATGSWVENADANNNGHAYSHLAMNPDTRECDGRNNGNDAIRYWPGSGTSRWGNVAGFGNSERTIADALEWWPDANAGQGGLLYYTRWGNSGRCKLSNPTVTSWNTEFASGFDSGGASDIHVAALWCPGQRVMMVGGGNDRNTFVQLNPDGTTRRRAAHSGHWGPGFEGTNGSMVAFENGRIFHISLAANALLEYSFDADRWSTVGPLPFGRFWHASCSIDGVDVIHVMVQESSSQSSIKQYLYKL